jgi:hypothetical protein
MSRELNVDGQEKRLNWRAMWILCARIWTMFFSTFMILNYLGAVFGQTFKSSVALGWHSLLIDRDLVLSILILSVFSAAMCAAIVVGTVLIWARFNARSKSRT